MSGPANAVVGDQELPTNLPETTVPEETLIEEKKMATYSQTAEFKRLSEFMEDRIKFFQMFLPDGRLIKDIPTSEPLGENWRAANIVITEFRNVLDQYDRAREVVKNARPRND